MSDIQVQTSGLYLQPIVLLIVMLSFWQNGMLYINILQLIIQSIVMIIKHLQKRYIESAKECIINSYKEEGSLQKMFQIPQQQVHNQKLSFDNYIQYKNCLIAVDNNDKVIGTFLGIDLHTLLRKLKLPNPSKTYEFITKNIMIPALQRFIKQIQIDITPGLVLYGNRFCVDPKYLKQGLGTKLALQFTKNAKINNYKFTFGIISHPASHKIMLNNKLKCITIDFSQIIYKNKKITGVANLFYDELSKSKL